MTFETTDRVQTETEGDNYVYELYRFKWTSDKLKKEKVDAYAFGDTEYLNNKSGYPAQVPASIEYSLEFDREILKYGITTNPQRRYASQRLPNFGGRVIKNHIHMNVINSNITRGEAYYLEGLYAMQYAKKYGSFPTAMPDRTEADIKWSEEG